MDLNTASIPPCSFQNLCSTSSRYPDYQQNPLESALQQGAPETKGAPYQFFDLFLNADVLDWLLKETNRNVNHLRNCRRTLTPVTSDELRCFIGILLLFGYLEVPRRRMLWEMAKDCHNTLVANALQRDRFETILSSVFALENSERISSFLDVANRGFVNFVPKDSQHVIGECSLQPPRHCSKAKSLKAWCGSTREGYCTFIGYNKSTSGEVFKQNMVEFYSAMFHNCRTNFYNLDISIDEPDQGDTDKVQPLTELESRYSTVYGEVSGGFSRDNLTGGLSSGLDKLETCVNLYRIRVKRRRTALMLIVTFFLDAAVNNAWILYKGTSNAVEKMADLLAFRRSVVIYYLQRYPKPLIGRKLSNKGVKVSNKKNHLGDARFDGVRHYVVPQDRQTRCAKCAMKTTTRCHKCDVGVHVRCFIEFHTKET